MGTGNFTDDFKRDAVAQNTDRGYPIKEVSERLGVSLHPLNAWKRKFAKLATGETEKQTTTDRVRAMLARPQGATLEAICEATGWQPHSARAVLSELRKSGAPIARKAASDGQGRGSVYRIAAASEVGS
jgi:transposase